MLCQDCRKRVANVHFTQIVNHNKVEMYLCDQCAKEQGQFNFGPPLSINDFFSGIVGLNNTAAYIPQASQCLVCNNCGMSFEEFQKHGKIGCSHCYEIYGERLNPILKRLHGNIEHHGKVPGKAFKGMHKSKEVEKLRELLNKAVKNEEYEKAAEIRDQIKNLEVEL